MLKRIGKLTIGILFLMLGLYSCKTIKSTGDLGMVRMDSPDVFSARLKLSIYQGKKKQNLNGSVKMVRDEFIQLSLVAPVLRTEAVRIVATPHEMLLIDRIHKQYAITPAAGLKVLLGNQMDYQQLQHILSDAVFLENADGWYIKEGNVKINIPVQNGSTKHELKLELNKITVPEEKPARINPPSRYEEKELKEIVELIEGL